MTKISFCCLCDGITTLISLLAFVSAHEIMDKQKRYSADEALDIILGMDEPSESEDSFDNNSTDSVDSMSDEEECEGTNDQTGRITSVCSFSKNPSKRRAPRTRGCLFRRGLRTRGGAR